MHHITLIVAMDKNGVIGKGGELPWRLSRDMKHFAETTTGKTVVQGRKTYDSLPPRFKPLPNRRNIIMTRQESFTAPGCIVVHSVEEVLALASLTAEVFVIGGVEIYEAFLPYADKIFLTEVDAEIENGDAFFPPLGPEWRRKLLWRHDADQKNDFAFWVIELTR